jgi:hypothetical protein
VEFKVTHIPGLHAILAPVVSGAVKIRDKVKRLEPVAVSAFPNSIQE